jgi:uncharacterized iron-regulated protein
VEGITAAMIAAQKQEIIIRKITKNLQEQEQTSGDESEVKEDLYKGTNMILLQKVEIKRGRQTTNRTDKGCD